MWRVGKNDRFASTISYILGQKPEIFSLEAADINKDGVVNIVDVTSMISIILNKTTETEEEEGNGNDV